MQEVYTGVTLEGYEFLERLGEGGYSSVYKVRSLKCNRMFVAKVTRVRNSNMDRAWKAFDSEIQALMRLDHPHIIKLYAHFRVDDNFVLILEYCRRGSLEEYVKVNGAITGDMLLRIVRELCSALNYAWSVGVHHRDIKPGNVLIDEAGWTKLADFGISITDEECCERNSEISDFKCSLVCAAPEILNRIPYDPVKSDIWATGVTILWLANGKIPWNTTDVEEAKRRIQYGQFIIPNGFDPALLQYVRGMMKMCPRERVFPTTAELDSLSPKILLPLSKTAFEAAGLGLNVGASTRMKAFRGRMTGRLSNRGVVKTVGTGNPLVPLPRRKEAPERVVVDGPNKFVARNRASTLGPLQDPHVQE